MTNNKIGTYLLYAIGVIVLVVAGILIAVSIDDANQAHKERQIEIKYLKSLEHDLNIDKANLVKISQARDSVISSGLVLINPTAPKNFNEYVDMVTHLTIFIRWRAYVPSNNTFKELTSSGNLNILKNDSIKAVLMEVDQINSSIVNLRDHVRYEYNNYIYNTYFKEEELFKLFDFEKYIKSEDWEREYIPLEEEELKLKIENTLNVVKSKQFSNALKMTLVNSKVLIEYCNELIHYIDQLLIQINKDINEE